MAVVSQSRTSIVFDSLDILSNFCGANNVNINYLETLFESPIYIVGNKIEFFSEVKSKIRDFENMCEYLVTCIKKSVNVTTELISSAYYQMTGGNLDEVISRFDINTIEDTTYGKESAHDKTQITEPQLSAIEIPSTKKRIIARTKGQAEVISTLKKYDLSFLEGPAGTGKTFLTTAFAISLLLQKKVKKYIITRPVVEAGEKLGFLPGDLREKIFPYLRPIYDALYSVASTTIMNHLQENAQIEVAPLAYMRGRTLHNSIVLLDEAQNCTVAQMKMFLTRIGENSKVIVNGDLSQSDLNSKVKRIARCS